jgi:hypothetical protein
MTLLSYATRLTDNAAVSREIIAQAWLYMVEMDGDNSLLVAEIRRRCYEWIKMQ